MTTRRAFLVHSARALGSASLLAALPGLPATWPAWLQALALAPGAAGAGADDAGIAALAARPRPSPSQLAWQRDERALFIHFGINTFTNREWGDGTEDPALFDPSSLDARQWAKAARAGGFRAMILTAKHHDGFCLWPTATTKHSMAASPWRGGRGDVVQEFVDACRAEGLRPGLYLSPWDRNASVYGTPAYNDFYCDQLTELLTHYGPLAEVWFDGANGEGPNGKKQEYDWARYFDLVRRLQPEAVMFSDAGPDVRWCGNEAGVAGDPDWSTVDPEAVPYPGASGPGVRDALQHGDPLGSVWRPAEADVSVRPGWFYHPAENDKVRSVDDLVGLYFTSVGRNSKLLLNVPPTPAGLLHDVDVARLAGMRSALSALFAEDFAEGLKVEWRRTGARTAVAELDPGRTVPVGLVRLEERIERGQAVARYRVETAGGGEGGEAGTGMGGGDSVCGKEHPRGAWRVLSRGTTIGYAKLDRFRPTPVRRVRVVVEAAVAVPEPLRVRLYGG